MRWLYKLESRFGRFHIPNLMRVVVAGMAFVFLVDFVLYTIPLSSFLSLNRQAIFSGQVWRLITFVFVPPASGGGFGSILLFVQLYFYYMMGSALENAWGGFRFNFYYLVGILGAILACFISPTGFADNTALNLSLLLAFATLAPDTSFLLFFILPIKASWIAILSAFILVLGVVQAFLLGPAIGISALVTTAFGVANYLLFFGKDLFLRIREKIRIAKNRRNWRNR